MRTASTAAKPCQGDSSEFYLITGNYVPGLAEPEHAPLSPEYVPKPVYPEYLASSNDDIPADYQPLHADVLATALSSGYIADSNPKVDPEDDLENDPKDDPTDYPANRGDEEEDEESYEDNADDEDKKEASEEEEDDDKEKEYLTRSNSSTTLIVTVVAALPSSLLLPSLLTPLSSSFLRIPSLPLPLPSPSLPLPAPSTPLLLPATDCREDVPEANVSPRKRQPGLDVTHATNYDFVDTVDATPGRPVNRKVGCRITDVWDDIVGDMEETTLTTLEAVNQRVADLATTLA
uniref:Uncharacterized protein n=1 Tax=Tanacetum cinerariifolium TaxID=118510 RepID=A0A6L2JZP0_TANCI|nr:hypothetical protein [Tanacetum cinerariifolium]